MLEIRPIGLITGSVMPREPHVNMLDGVVEKSRIFRDQCPHVTHISVHPSSKLGGVGDFGHDIEVFVDLLPSLLKSKMLKA